MKFDRTTCIMIATGPIVIELTLVKFHQKLVVHTPWGKRPTLCICCVWKKADIVKINDDDDWKEILKIL